jgi:hypothetical protein
VHPETDNVEGITAIALFYSVMVACQEMLTKKTPAWSRNLDKNPFIEKLALSK